MRFVNKESVMNAIKLIIERGEKPTFNKIREELGGGSNQTIMEVVKNNPDVEELKNSGNTKRNRKQTSTLTTAKRIEAIEKRLDVLEGDKDKELEKALKEVDRLKRIIQNIKGQLE